MASFVAGVSVAGEDSPLVSGEMNSTGVDLFLFTVASLATAPVVTDSKSNSWSAAIISQLDIGEETRLTMWYSIPTSVGSGHTFTATQAGGIMAMSVLGFSGADQVTQPDDTSSAASPDSAVALQAGPVTPTGVGEIFVTALMQIEDGASAWAVDSGFTLAHSIPYDPDDGSQHLGLFTAYRIYPGMEALDPEWTWSGAILAAAGTASFLVSGMPSALGDLRVFGLGQGIGLGQMGGFPFVPPVSTGYWRPQWRPRRRR